MIKIIREDSYTLADAPNYFFLVTERRDLLKADFLTGQLDGVTGISDSGFIMLDFLGVGRDAVVMMPGIDTININNLSRVMYDNPHYLVSQGLKALFRIWSKNYRHRNPSEYGQVIQTFSTYVDRATSDRQLKQALNPSIYSYSSAVRPHFEELNKVQNLSQFLKVYRKILSELSNEPLAQIVNAMPNLEFREMVLAGFKALADSYGREGEWIVKKGSLNVPRNSRIVLSVPYLSDFEQWNMTGRISDTFSERDKEVLEKRYVEILGFIDKAKQVYQEVSFIDSNDFTEFQTQMIVDSTLSNEAKINRLMDKYTVFLGDYA